MTKLHRILALAAIATIPAAAAAAGPYDPYQPTSPYQATTPGPTTPGSPFGETTALPPKAIAGNLRDDAADALDEVTVKQLLSKKRSVTLAVAVTGAGIYRVELERKVTTRKGRKTRISYFDVASGSVFTKSAVTGDRTIKLKLTAYGRRYLSSFVGGSITLKLRSGFEPLVPKSARTSWTNRTDVTIDVAKLQD